jgi:hypothetical protein
LLKQIGDNGIATNQNLQQFVPMTWSIVLAVRLCSTADATWSARLVAKHHNFGKRPLHFADLFPGMKNVQMTLSTDRRLVVTHSGFVDAKIRSHQ